MEEDRRGGEGARAFVRSREKKVNGIPERGYEGAEEGRPRRGGRRDSRVSLGWKEGTRGSCPVAATY
jgi:hypothetical protein